MNSARTALTYSDGDQEITLCLGENWEANGWQYSDPKDGGDGCFYYYGQLLTGHLTPKLLEQVTLSEAAFALTKDYTLRIDVIADAVQTGGSAPDARDWKSGT